MAKDKKQRAQGKKTDADKQKQQKQPQGLSAWVWMLIGAAVGYAGWLAIRLISGLLGG